MSADVFESSRLAPAGNSRAALARIGAVSGTQRLILRLEGGAVLAAAAAAYAHAGQGWGLFALMFLVPDLSMLGYLRGPRLGAACYNAGHSYLGPAALGAVALAAAQPLGVALALIWIAHIGFDRLLGYGLKHVAGFGFTHLGAVGSARTR
jgi:hypothetical protein